MFYDRIVRNEEVTLFSPDVAHGKLYKYFFEDSGKFEKLYLELEADPTIRKKKVKGMDILAMSLITERAQTARIYIHNVDNSIDYGVFDPVKAPVRQSNLCMEILLPTTPMGTENEEIALCTLAGFNLGILDSFQSFLNTARVLVRALDNLLDYQEYPNKAALKNKLRRTLGIGVINYAYTLAKRRLDYGSKEGLEFTADTFEKIQYALLWASAELAEEKGKCELFGDTKYADGWLPIDNINEKLNSIYDIKSNLKLDWEALRAKIAKSGLRNSTLTALMPSETSSQISNATNGIEPPRSWMTVKTSKDGVYKQIVPELQELFFDYTYAWDEKFTNKGYLRAVATMQAFVDQSISANTYYNPARYADTKVPAIEVLADIIYAHSLGVKTLYYHNTNDGSDSSIDTGCSGGGCTL